MNKILILLSICLVAVFPAFSQQLKSFSPDSVVYIQELEKFTDNYINDTDEESLDNFISFWNSDSCGPEQRTEIVQYSNLLLKKNGRPSPHFIMFFQNYLLLQGGNYSYVNVPAWKESFRFFLESRSHNLKVTEQFLELSLNLLLSNTLYNSSATIWKIPGNSYYFDFNSGKPQVIFQDVDLICYSKRDSIHLMGTSGTLNPVDLSWTGNKGRITWERAGLDDKEVYADLSNYRISLQKTEYKADSVQFYYKKYFDYPLLGRIEEKVMLINKPENATYPKFFSYQNKYLLPGLFRGVEFEGGLSMQGSKLVGTGNEYEPATLQISDGDTLRMKLLSNQILILESGMRSNNISLTMYLDRDSLYHPDLQLVYQEATDAFSFTKSQSYTSEGPYKNTYHRIDMNFAEFYWDRKSGTILFKPLAGTAIGQATFESNSFFNYEFFEKLQGMSDIHPLVGIWQYCRYIGMNQFPASNYADYLNVEDYQVRQQLMKLSRLGFIYFNDVSDMVRMNDKLYYFLDASIGKTDYDVIYFTSETPSSLENASLNLSNYDLTINGIDRIFLSDSQNVVLLPDKNQIIMKRNRNFQFNGTIRAGLFTYYGNNFFFDYDGFRLNLQNIDSISLKVKTGESDNYGQSIIRGISNLIEQVTGELLIDDPGNKSGLKDHPNYPVFTSRENAFVYFDEPAIQKGVYKRNTFFFEVYPFSIDSLDNFTREGMQLDGRFVSGGIIPPIEQKLSLRDDYSLGFYLKSGAEGVPVYNGAGRFFNDIELSNRGLHGYGQLDYLTSTTYSDDFLFHPDSLMAISREFLIRKQTAGTEFPKVKSSENRMVWYPEKDQLYAFRQTADFTMFSDTVRLTGNLLLEPSGLSGNGRMNLVDATLGSKEFRYKSEKILSDSSDLRVVSPGLEIPAMNTDNVNLDIDFNLRKGKILANEDFTLVEFQENRYISKLDFFNWDMKRKEFEMGLSAKLNEPVYPDSLSGARYISVHPQQDSLSFVSEKTVFDYKNLLLNAQAVKHLQVADAWIYPKDGKLTVEKNARIRRLSQAGILASSQLRYYSLYNSNADILGRLKYTASGDYDYIDENRKPWLVHFHEIKVDTSVQTIGKATLSLLDSFRLSPYFEFQGEVRLAAKDKYLTFDGATRLTHQCQPGRSWLKFETHINPDSIMIPLSAEPIDINLKRIYAGSMITRDSTHIYSTFLSGRNDYFDSYLTNAEGFLRFDKPERHYEIASVEKLASQNATGNYLRLDIDSCYQFGEGKIQYNVDFGQVKIFSTGQATHDMEKNTYSSRILLGLDFFFSAEAMNVFSSELDSLANLKPFDLTDPFYRLALRDFIGKDKAETMENELGLYGNYKDVPENFNKNLIISDVRLKWNQNSRSFRYHGPVGIIRVGSNPVNKVVEAYIELSKRGSGDLLDVYFVLDPNTYYYFGYNPGSMQVTSSNRLFNSIVYDLKDTDRRLKVQPGSTGYIYALAPDRRVELFLRRYMEAEEEETDGK